MEHEVPLDSYIQRDRGINVANENAGKAIAEVIDTEMWIYRSYSSLICYQLFIKTKQLDIRYTLSESRINH